MMEVDCRLIEWLDTNEGGGYECEWLISKGMLPNDDIKMQRLAAGIGSSYGVVDQVDQRVKIEILKINFLKTV